MTSVSSFQAGGQPVISVDTKKKELIGNYANAGTEWSRGPERVNDHDFADKQLGKVAPYGVYDLTANAGWVNVGTSADTAAFAVESIRRWWYRAAPAMWVATIYVACRSGAPAGPARHVGGPGELVYRAADLDARLPGRPARSCRR